jgi:hypothetical protein
MIDPGTGFELASSKVETDVATGDAVPEPVGAFVERVAGTPIRTVINAHHHVDHSGKTTLTDGTRRIDVPAIEGGVHVQGFTMIHLPAERLLIEADAFTPGAARAASRPIGIRRSRPA